MIRVEFASKNDSRFDRRLRQSRVDHQLFLRLFQSRQKVLERNLTELNPYLVAWRICLKHFCVIFAESFEQIRTKKWKGQITGIRIGNGGKCTSGHFWKRRHDWSIFDFIHVHCRMRISNMSSLNRFNNQIDQCTRIPYQPKQLHKTTTT